MIDRKYTINSCFDQEISYCPVFLLIEVDKTR